ncbi:MAG: hypothetical protein M1518_02450 [Candidatus Thermoplasmatota archaeon]|nr:hypothetical protein [Candidatus Thermoplasmatota archaeon]
MLRQHLVLVALLVTVATVLAFAPAQAVNGNSSAEKVPMVNLISVELGNHPFDAMETFQIHPGKSEVVRTVDVLNLSYETDLISPINDTLSVNDSIHISKNQIDQDFLSENGTFEVSAPPKQSYLNSISVSGNTSYSYVTMVEMVPANEIQINGVSIDGIQQVQSSSIYNLTIDYGNASFVLHSPGLIYIGNALTNISLSINSNMRNGNSLLSFSFPIKNGNYTFTFNQILSSGQSVNDYVMSYYQVSGFSSLLMQNLFSNSISLATGGAIFVILMLALFIYYKKK